MVTVVELELQPDCFECAYVDREGLVCELDGTVIGVGEWCDRYRRKTAADGCANSACRSGYHNYFVFEAFYFLHH